MTRAILVTSFCEIDSFPKRLAEMADHFHDEQNFCPVGEDAGGWHVFGPCYICGFKNVSISTIQKAVSSAKWFYREAVTLICQDEDDDQMSIVPLLPQVIIHQVEEPTPSALP